MAKRSTSALLRSACALVAAGLCLLEASGLAGTEAGAGRLTGPLIELCLGGGVGMLICAALLLTRWPVAALLTPVAALLCLPLLLYRIAPSSLTWLTDAPASVASAQPFNPDPLAIAGLAALLVAVLVNARGRASAE